ncbi:FAD/NAD(P)-binding protein [Agrobacterium rosae]|uniref:FAD/NAD(P)-binding protein n=1 Tax=Agrobacterium rosae TaxID=1972867 RepID=A0AAE5VNR7_9HYPH|nr:FAD/NAD(P)-binding protein [Agrobacterium rosae]KAA3515988.1 hydroxyacylglutathione hydrolase [Agrobacterium rosae]KAA3524947.1 hydroxyacylglutathione hydrolase [Agrobacterium rosae]MCM2431504.1 NAD(P)-binding protein [Agrobacterium rosae]MDX8328830.1 FAD/NAD(P)-binding protein [Agrobacterium rosae]MQB46953.1 hydroxyacylglutathione hydrolase [Agrobacterium rosae]
MSSASELPVVAVIGGGFSGAAFALHLSALSAGKVGIVVFEPRSRLGAGLAYSTAEPAHRINVPAGRMSLYPDDPESFLRYLATTDEHATDAALIGRDGQPYPRRHVFGDYVEAEIAPLLSSGAVEHRKAEVVSIVPSGEDWDIADSQNGALRAQFVVLAVSHPAPGLLRPLLPFKDHPKLVADVTVPAALAPIATEDHVLILGNGLTAADVVAALEKRGHRGKITSVSRRGLRSRGHAPAAQEPFGDFSSKPSLRASALLRVIRRSIEEAKADGLTWHAVLDAVRGQAFAIWRALPVAERRRIVRLARPFWDAHRFRIAPQVEDALDRAIAEDRLAIAAARLKRVVPEGNGFRVILSPRHMPDDQEQIFDAIVVTTGPAHEGILQSQPFLAALAEAGHLSLCKTGLGIACDLDARVLGNHGAPTDNLFVAGPLARGTFGELMGLPQVTEHAVFVAQQVASALQSAGTPLPEAPLYPNLDPNFCRLAV